MWLSEKGRGKQRCFDVLWFSRGHRQGFDEFIADVRLEWGFKQGCSSWNQGKALERGSKSVHSCSSAEGATLGMLLELFLSSSLRAQSGISLPALEQPRGSSVTAGEQQGFVQMRPRAWASN